jgi:penicillin-binding protein 2
VLDVATSEVLAAVSLPTYDLNLYRQEYEKLAADELDFPLLNKALGVRYPPGSTCKPLTAIAALSTGTITPGTVFTCRGYLSKPGEFKCDGIHGEIALMDAIKKSCNVYFYNVGERMKLAPLSDWMGRFGYADEPGTGLPEEQRGILPDPRKIQGAGEARFLAMGQGKITVTPLHVADAMATIARGGEFVTPLLVKELADAQRRHTLHATASAVQFVREGMRQAVNEPGGTAYSWARDDEIEICGKTGTAQTEPRWADLNGNGRKDEGEILRSGDTAWFVGFAPARNPQVAFAVLVEYSGEHGGTVCGPIARDVMHLCKNYGYLK